MEGGRVCPNGKEGKGGHKTWTERTAESVGGSSGAGGGRGLVGGPGWMQRKGGLGRDHQEGGGWADGGLGHSEAMEEK